MVAYKKSRLIIPSVVFLCFTSNPNVSAVDFERGELYGSFDTTFSYGQSFRVQSRDDDLIGLANGGNAFSVNGDDGNLNYDTGLISSTLKFTSELELNFQNFGAFVRGTGFKDFQNDDADDTVRTPLHKRATDLVGEDLKLLDAYIRAGFDIGTMPLDIRAGEQVISWGESTFIQNSINTINPVDVSKLRVPGSELKEALLPVGMVSASLGLTDNLSMEAFYQYDYERILIDPTGSFFSTNDIAGNAGSKLFLGFGDISDLGTTVPGSTTGLPTINVPPLFTPQQAGGFNADFGSVARLPDDRPDEGGEYGMALRLFSPDLNDTEFGFYFINYHSRLPIISAVSGSTAGVGNTVAAATAAGAIGIVGSTLATAIGTGAGIAAGGDNAAGAAAIGADCAFAAAFGLTPPEFVGSPLSFPTQCALDQYAQTANYFVEFPEDIQLLGLSFNTELGKTGIALQGEYSFRHDAPLQIDVQELLLAAGSTLNTNATLAANPTIAGLTDNQITNGGILPTGTIVPGFIERDVSQIQMTASKVFGPTFGANTAVLVGEFAVTHIHDMPSKSTLRLEAPGTDTTGNPFHSTAAGFHPGKPAESSDNFPDATSWGYQIRGVLQYLNVLGAINVSPNFAWRHDVSGITPGPGGNFLEGSKAISLGLGFSYQNEWQADLSYTNFFGAGRHNVLNDRDFASFSVSFSF
jgi:hypothetical protein